MLESIVSAKKKYVSLDEVIKMVAERDPELGREIESWTPVVAIVGALVRLRRRAGLTQADVAKRVGRKQSAIARLESAEQDPRWTTVVETLAALGHRLQIVPAEGDLYLLTGDQLDELIERHIAEAFDHLKSTSTSAALRRVARTHGKAKQRARDRAKDLVVEW